MNEPAPALLSDDATDGGAPKQIRAVRTPVGAAKAILEAIGRWCSAPPKLKAYVASDPTQEDDGARAARMKRTQDAVDALFAAPDPEEASLARFWGG